MSGFAARILRASYVRGAAAVVSAFLFAAHAAAQGPVLQRPANAFTGNPLGIPFEIYAAEFEHRLSDVATVGVSGSYFGPDKDFSIGSLDAKLRLYINEEAMRGFSVGVSLGWWHGSEDSSSGSRSASRAAVGAVVDYNWIMGQSKRILVGAGVGAKRVFGKDVFSDIPLRYPTARFQIGVLF